MSFYGPKWTPSREEYLTQLVGTVSKCTKDAETVYARLVMVSIWGWKRTLAGKRVHHNGSIDTSFDPPLFSLDSTFNNLLNITYQLHVPPTKSATTGIGVAGSSPIREKGLALT